ncbi:MAG TPA: hypothetical protein VE912_14965 [Bacteroidales bacterium]|nr:hypothetical protein [Bacteroidales bacterium]
MSKKVISLIIITLVVLFIGYSILNIQESKSEYKFEKIEYFEKGFKGILISKNLNRGIRIRLKTSGKQLEKYLYSSKNFDYNPDNLYDFIMQGDSIVKVPNSLDLYIFRDDKKYYFKLGEYIND